MLFRKFHHSLAFLMAVFYLATVMKPAFPVLDYTFHYGTYANVLCENKDKPELQCNGTCQLAEKLNLETSKEEPALPEFESLYWYMAIPTSDNYEIARTHSLKSSVSEYFQSKIAAVYLEQPTPPPIV